MKLLGIILILAGILALAYQGFSYNKTEKDLQVGSLQVEHTEKKMVYLPPVVGGGLVVVGAVALVIGFRQSS